MNNLQLVGTIGNIKFQEQNGDKKSVVQFSIAISKGKDKQPTWVWISSFDKTANFVNNNFVVGMVIAVTGSLSTSTYEGKTQLKVIGNSVSFVPGTKPKSSFESQAEPTSNDMDHIPDYPVGDNPF